MITKKRKLTITVWISILLIYSCEFNNKKTASIWSELPTVTRLEQLSKTEFVATIENPISETKNTIYAPSFLFAWEKIKEELKSPVVITEKNTLDFRLLNESKSHKGTLTEDEYSAEAEIIGNGIIAKA